jgi:hypothetical protein
MKTPNQIEKALTDGAAKLHQLLKTDHHTYNALVLQSKKELQDIRKSYGFKSAGSLLSGDISKLQKDERTTLGLALLPAIHSGLGNVCAFADSCADTCVAFSGNGGFSTTYNVRLARTSFMIANPQGFMALLFSEIFDAYTKAQTYEQGLAIRLNTYSDIRWEKVAPWLFDMFVAVKFYDYTKHPMSSRPEATRPKNYHLTYSVSEKTTESEIGKAIDARRPLAVVVSVRSGKVKGSESMRPIPQFWGGIPTIDGDSSDARYLNNQSAVVILRRKHTMRENHPMILKAAKLSGDSK